jgi:hypothetical protein
MTGSTTAWRAAIISDAAGLARIAPAWDALWQAAAPLRPSPALRHGYIGLGLRHASGDAAPVIVLVWQAEQLRLAPPATTGLAALSGVTNADENAFVVQSEDFSRRPDWQSFWTDVSANVRRNVARGEGQAGLCVTVSEGPGALSQQAQARGPGAQFIMGPFEAARHDEALGGGLLRSRRACRVIDVSAAITRFSFAGRRANLGA